MTGQGAGREADRQPRQGAGYRTLPHPADVVIEAWGPTLAGCLAQAVLGVVSTFADCAGLAPTGECGFRLAEAPGEDVLLRVLEEVIYRFEVDGVVPVDAQVEPDATGGFAVRLGTVEAHRVLPAGPAPKAVAHSGLEASRTAAGWTCRALVDV